MNRVDEAAVAYETPAVVGSSTTSEGLFGIFVFWSGPDYHVALSGVGARKTVLHHGGVG